MEVVKKYMLVWADMFVNANHVYNLHFQRKKWNDIKWQSWKIMWFGVIRQKFIFSYALQKGETD